MPAACDYRGYLFKDLESGTAAIRSAVQECVAATMLRLSDAEETRFTRLYNGLGKGRSLARRLTGFISRCAASTTKLRADRRVRRRRIGRRARAKAVRRHRAQVRRLSLGRSTGERWRQTRFQAPYLRDPIMDRGLGVDTLETAVSWSKLGVLYAATRAALEAAILKTVPREGAKGIVMCHIGHSTADGAGLTFTTIFPRSLDGDIAQWKTIKRAASEAIAASGGTISHHHGVGEDHLPWIAQEKGALGIEVLRAVKQALDPAGVLNPGKLLPG